MSDYNWKDDSIKSWALWLRFMRLTSGRTTFKSITEMYDVESWGLVP